ncbi:hypothetical protein VP01_1149g2 [Puccinia sorghi]|uniref:Uncharacterized protein n=1 Tax=Puccinia sorghi TaxID=27349 RepID=A0A0L6VRT6_9BASI|nr:hypothetical protein VP01_1149g2 [Puccinia sorghi]
MFTVSFRVSVCKGRVLDTHWRRTLSNLLSRFFFPQRLASACYFSYFTLSPIINLLVSPIIMPVGQDPRLFYKSFLKYTLKEKLPVVIIHTKNNYHSGDFSLSYFNNDEECFLFVDSFFKKKQTHPLFVPPYQPISTHLESFSLHCFIDGFMHFTFLSMIEGLGRAMWVNKPMSRGGQSEAASQPKKNLQYLCPIADIHINPLILPLYHCWHCNSTFPSTCRPNLLGLTTQLPHSPASANGSQLLPCLPPPLLPATANRRPTHLSLSLPLPKGPSTTLPLLIASSSLPGLPASLPLPTGPSTKLTAPSVLGTTPSRPPSTLAASAKGGQNNPPLAACFQQLNTLPRPAYLPPTLSSATKGPLNQPAPCCLLREAHPSLSAAAKNKKKESLHVASYDDCLEPSSSSKHLIFFGKFDCSAASLEFSYATCYVINYTTGQCNFKYSKLTLQNIGEKNKTTMLAVSKSPPQKGRQCLYFSLIETLLLPRNYSLLTPFLQ